MRGKKDGPRIDKKRHTLENRIHKYRVEFDTHKDKFYEEKLGKLQAELSTLHDSTNQEYIRELRDLEEARDLELMRLKLFEQYMANHSQNVYEDTILSANKDSNELLEVCQKRMTDLISIKIENLKNSHNLEANSVAVPYGTSRRKTNSARYSRNNESDNYDKFFISSGNSSTESMANTDATSGRRSRRARHSNLNQKFLLDQQHNQDLSGATSNKGGSVESNIYAGSRESTPAMKEFAPNITESFRTDLFDYYLSGDETNMDILVLLFGEKFCQKQEQMRHGRSATRVSNKAPPQLTSLGFDEVSSDISEIRKLTQQLPAPFK